MDFGIWFDHLGGSEYGLRGLGTVGQESINNHPMVEWVVLEHVSIEVVVVVIVVHSHMFVCWLCPSVLEGVSTNDVCPVIVRVVSRIDVFGGILFAGHC